MLCSCLCNCYLVIVTLWHEVGVWLFVFMSMSKSNAVICHRCLWNCHKMKVVHLQLCHCLLSASTTDIFMFFLRFSNRCVIISRSRALFMFVSAVFVIVVLQRMELLSFGFSTCCLTIPRSHAVVLSVRVLLAIVELGCVRRHYVCVLSNNYGCLFGFLIVAS